MNTKIRVNLIKYTPEPEKVIAAAAKLCYSQSGAYDIMDGLTDEATEKFLARLTEMGHGSPTEHASFTFAIEGVSRSLTHQLVRHRLASYSQQSQRYVPEKWFEYVIPPEIDKDEELSDIFIKSMMNAQNTYISLADKLSEKYIADGMSEKDAEKKAIEDARYVLPNAWETKIVVTMNARELIHFFNQRCCNRAQWEIRALAIEMLRLVKEVAPTLFKNAGPKCVNGPCPEGTMCCGDTAAVRERFKNL